MKKRSISAISRFAILFAIGSVTLLLLGCNPGKQPRNETIHTEDAATVSLYFIARYPLMGATAFTGSYELASPGDDWLSSALNTIESTANVKLNLHPLKSWMIPDPPSKRYDVLLDEEELRNRMDGVLPGNPYDDDPESCDLVFFDSGRIQMQRYREIGYFIPVEGLLKTHAPNLWSSYPPSYWESQRIDGEIWGIPALGGQPDNVMPPFWIIREDILSDQGIPEPDSFEDLIDVAIKLKSADVVETPILLAGRFNILEYMLEINGYRSLLSNLFFYDSRASTVSTILDEPHQVLETAVNILEKTREYDIELAAGNRRVLSRYNQDEYSSVAGTPNWFAMYFDYYKPAADVFRTLALLSHYYPDMRFSVRYFEPENKLYFKYLYPSYRYTYFIPAHTDKAVEIVRMFETMNTRTGYNRLFTVDGKQVSNTDELVLYKPNPSFSGISAAQSRYPMIVSLCSNPYYIPVSEQVYSDDLRDYYRRYASHQLVEYYWDNFRITDLDWDAIYNEYSEISGHFLSGMNAYFRGESRDTTWITRLKELEPRITSLKKMIQMQLDAVSF